VRRRLLGAVALAIVFAAPARAQEQVIYSSLPLTGASAGDARDTLDGERLALAEAGAPVTLRSLDDSTRAAENWDPGQTAKNARRAAEDPATIAYIGDFNSGASSISIPILNEAGIPQISPSNTYPGLTRGGPMSERGEPEKYYPTDNRTYVRVSPADQLQAAALAKLLATLRVRRVALVNDGEVYGGGLGRLVAEAAQARGVKVVAAGRLSRHGRNVRTLARRARAGRAQAVLYTGVTANGAVGLAHAVHRALPRAMLVASDGCFDTAFTRHLSRGEAKRTLIMFSVIPGRSLGAAGAAFADRFRARFHRTDGGWGAYGYEAMALALDAITRAGGPTAAHAAVVQQLFATHDRDSILGRYSIDADGDTTLSTYGVYRVRSRRPSFAFVVDSAAP
jgi:branched-chain amino acid transport system substrate-binding protein